MAARVPCAIAHLSFGSANGTDALAPSLFPSETGVFSFALDVFSSTPSYWCRFGLQYQLILWDVHCPLRSGGHALSGSLRMS